jgi:hypothetical protein
MSCNSLQPTRRIDRTARAAASLACRRPDAPSRTRVKRNTRRVERKFARDVKYLDSMKHEQSSSTI